ncbi:MAG TPA: TIGR03086 family metal-binding protein [Mycobacteriales bacterium]|jgi:uncharacterized protein (TIGR03086 family)|nr:TIGR03086 family metal-binding protein [Mycobacteriales bacterium]
MTDLSVLLARGLGEFERRVRRVSARQWQDPTPCSGWDVRALVNHVTVEQLWAPELFRGRTIEEVGDRFAGDQLGSDPVATWERAAAGSEAAFSVEDALLGRVHLSYGLSAASHYCGEMTVDLVVHTWDLARAIGADERLDDELVGYAYEQGLARGTELSESGWFAAAVPVAEDAPLPARMLALYGRVA